ncbi:MAG: hypothetical protein HQK89_02775 [Nitrospirae bacterium]|nr:hypothetical protein [Nitrospirota bacterium]
MAQSLGGVAGALPRKKGQRKDAPFLAEASEGQGQRQIPARELPRIPPHRVVALRLTDLSGMTEK